jgi:hypothetical protein
MQYFEQAATANTTPIAPAVIRNGAIVLLIANYVYALSFNLLPDNVRFVFAGGMFILNAVMAIIAFVSRPNSLNNLTVLAMMITIVCWGLSYATGYGGGGQGYTFRSAAKILEVYTLAIWVLSYPEVIPLRLVAFLSVGTLLGGGAYAILAPAAHLQGEQYFAFVTGVPQKYGALDLNTQASMLIGARHVSALFFLFNVLLVDQLRRLRVLSPVFAWALVILGAFLMLGYWSRNNMLILAVYFIVTSYHDSSRLRIIGPLYFLGAGLFLLAAIAFMSSISTEELYLLGSGRVGTYVHRWDLLSNRDWGSLLMGSGLGSDWFRSYTWWLDPRVSHNLYFSVIIETGFIGLVGLLVLLAAIYLRLPPGRGKSFFYIIVLSGLISHGFVSDSQFRIMLFAAMALAVVAYREEISGAPRP